MLDAVTRPKFLDPAWKPDLEKWYCGHCVDPTEGGTGWSARGSALSHSRDHLDGEDPEEGYDFLTGFDLRLALHRWRRRNEEGAAKFSRQLETIGTVDDFLTDCGVDVWPDWTD